MTNEQRIRDLERAVAMLMSALCQDEPRHFMHAQNGGPIRFVFHENYDGGINVDYEPA
jgi:hypothetical protein